MSFAPTFASGALKAHRVSCGTRSPIQDATCHSPHPWPRCRVPRLTTIHTFELQPLVKGPRTVHGPSSQIQRRIVFVLPRIKGRGKYNARRQCNGIRRPPGNVIGRTHSRQRPGIGRQPALQVARCPNALSFESRKHRTPRRDQYLWSGRHQQRPALFVHCRPHRPGRRTLHTRPSVSRRPYRFDPIQLSTTVVYGRDT